MKNQEQLNQDYDKIMIDFKQKAFIEGALKSEVTRLEDFVSYVYQAFSNNFNSEYQHIYLKPLNELSNSREKKQSFFIVSKCLPSTFWNTGLGEITAREQARLSVRDLFALQVTEERTQFYQSITPGVNFDTHSFVLELSNTDKIKIQENYSEFVDSFLNSPLLPENIKRSCYDELHNFLSYSVKEESQTNPSTVNFKKDLDFVKEVLSSVTLNAPFDQQMNKNFIQSLSIRKQLKY